MLKIITRAEALALELSKYYTGKPCKNGHLAEKTTRKSMCLECKKQEYRNHADRYKVANKKWKELNPELKQTLDKVAHKRMMNNPIRLEAKRKYGREYAAVNRKRMSELSKLWDAANPEKRLAYAKHHKAIRTRLIAGQELSKIYSKEIRQIYLDCPSGHHVDHIVPLRGDLVTGLHVPWNLQYLPALENIRKGNR